MELVLIDYKRPLTEQGPFNAIIHKLKPDLGEGGICVEGYYHPMRRHYEPRLQFGSMISLSIQRLTLKSG